MKTSPTPFAKVASKATVPALFTEGSVPRRLNPLLVSAVTVGVPPFRVRTAEKSGVPLTPAENATVPLSLIAGEANVKNGLGGTLL